MSQDIPTLSMTEAEIARQINTEITPDVIFDILVGQMQISQDAQQRISEEGIVVRNIGGLIIPHPAIKIQNDAEKIITNLMAKYAD